MEVQANSLVAEPSADLKPSCRLCGSPSLTVVKIFNEAGLCNDLGNNINLYLPVKVLIDDGLPEQCCWNCANTVMSWHNFYLSCQKTEEKLQVLKKSSEEEILQKESLQQADEVPETLEPSKQTKVEEVCIVSSDERLVHANLATSSSSGGPAASQPPAIRLVNIQSLLEPPKAPQKIELLRDKYELACRFCHAPLAEKKDLLIHIKKFHKSLLEFVVKSETHYECTRCKMQFASRELYETHYIFQHTKAILYRCKDCIGTFESLGFWKKHNRKEHEQRICEFCAKQMRNNHSLQKHLRTHNSDMPYTCTKCQANFKEKSVWFEHLKVHEGEIFQCTSCSASFDKEKKLIKHEAKHKREAFPCKSCVKTFKSQDALLNHQTVRHLPKPFLCLFCGKGFLTEQALRQHADSLHRTIMW